MYVNIYKFVLVLSFNTIYVFFLSLGFYGKFVGENRGRFIYSYIIYGLVWFFFFYFYVGFLYICFLRTFDIMINNRDVIRLYRILYFFDIRLEVRVCL